MSPTMSVDDAAASSDHTCTEVIYTVIVPVILMLILNIIAFGIVVIVLCQKNEKKKYADQIENEAFA